MEKMKDSGIAWINMIPHSWNIGKIKYTLQSRNESNNPIRSRDILSLTAKQGVIPLEEKEGGGNKPKEDYSAYKLAYPNDIVMNSMNVLSGSVGLSKYFGCVSPVYYMLRTINEQDDVRYFNYVFQTKVFQRSLLGLGNGILMKESDNGNYNTIRMRIPLDKLGNLFIPIPNSKTQKEIADFLDEKCAEIDSLIDDIQSEIDLLEEYKKTTITEAVTKGLEPSVSLKASRIFYMAPYNAKWRLSKIGYECQKLTRNFDASAVPLICSNKGKVSVRSENMSGIMVSEDNAMQGIYKGDIAIHGMDTWHGAIALSEYDGKITRVVHVCDSRQEKRFIVYYLQQLAFNGVYKLISNGVRGNTSDFRSWDKVSNIYISLPNIDEQKKIADFLDGMCADVEAIIREKSEQKNILVEYKKSLIYEYVTGKKEVI